MAKSLFEELGGKYERQGDYLIPCLTVPAEEEQAIGIWVIIMGLWYGMMPVLLKIGIPAALHVYCDLFSGKKAIGAGAGNPPVGPAIVKVV